MKPAPPASLLGPGQTWHVVESSSWDVLPAGSVRVCQTFDECEELAVAVEFVNDALRGYCDTHLGFHRWADDDGNGASVARHTGMGELMGKAIVVGSVIVIVVFAAFVFAAWWRARSDRRADKDAGRPMQGDLGSIEERELIELLHDARRILAPMHQTGQRMSGGPIAPLPDQLIVSVWLDAYDNLMKGMK